MKTYYQIFEVTDASVIVSNNDRREYVLRDPHPSLLNFFYTLEEAEAALNAYPKGIYYTIIKYYRHD